MELDRNIKSFKLIFDQVAKLQADATELEAPPSEPLPQVVLSGLLFLGRCRAPFAASCGSYAKLMSS